MNGGSQRRLPLRMPGARAIQQPKSQHHPTPSRGRKARRLNLRGQGRAQDWRDLPHRSVLINCVIVWIDERHCRLNVRRHRRREGGVDEDAGRVRAKPIILSPQFGLCEVFERPDARREVNDSLRARYRTRDRLAIEQVEVDSPGSVDIVALCTGQRNERTAYRATAPGDK